MDSTEATYGGEEHVGQPLLLTTGEAARALRISRSRLYELLARNEIPGVVRIGRSVRINRRSLEAWVEAQVNGDVA